MAEKKISIRHRKLLLYGPVLVTFIFVMLYRKFSGQRFNEYLCFGGVSVLVNLTFMFFFASMNIKACLQTYRFYSVLLLCLLALLIPYSIYFVLLSFIIAGFSMPFQT